MSSVKYVSLSSSPPKSPPGAWSVFLTVNEIVLFSTLLEVNVIWVELSTYDVLSLIALTVTVWLVE